MRRRPFELTPLSSAAETAEQGVGVTLNPVNALRRHRERRKEDQQERIGELGGEVVKKLFSSIVEHGMVSLFHNIETHELETEAYAAEFSSFKIKHLAVTLWRHHKQEFLGRPRLDLGIIESSHYAGANYRTLSVEQPWDAPHGDFIFRFSVGGTDDGSEDAMNRVKRISYKEKIQFLENILATEVDVRQTERKFGAAYTPGGIRPGSFRLPEDGDNTIYSGYWVKDIVGKLPQLPTFEQALAVDVAKLGAN
ncbi:MAG TPA: hypothetical protein VIH90_04645 [Candidatus Saccharimonadales bacterium]